MLKIANLIMMDPSATGRHHGSPPGPLFKKREMIHIYPLHISTQPSFKSTNKFVKPNVSSINLIVDLKMRCVEDVYIYIYIILVFFFLGLTLTVWPLTKISMQYGPFKLNS
jgi:hypothetical protein